MSYAIDVNTITSRIFPDNNDLNSYHTNNSGSEEVIIDIDLNDKFFIYCTNVKNLLFYY